MIQKKSSYWIVAILAFAFALSVPASAADSKEEKIASVNGTPVSRALLDYGVKNATSQGQKDSPELRLAIKQNLINRELLSQEAVKQGLDKTPDVTLMLYQARQNVLVDTLINDYLNKHPVSDEVVKAEYDKQVLSIGGDAQQYKISHIVLKTEAEAKDVLAKAKKGEDFAKLAKQFSIDHSKEDGSVDWLLANQIVPEVSNVIVNLSKGTVAASPIQTTSGWQIVRLDDKRPFKAPPFDEVKVNLKKSLIVKKQAEYLAKLRESAKTAE